MLGRRLVLLKMLGNLHGRRRRDTAIGQALKHIFFILDMAERINVLEVGLAILPALLSACMVVITTKQMGSPS